MEQRISIERLEQAINLFGSFDENIRLIESEFHVTVANREGELRVNGEPEDTMLACKALSALLTLSNRGEAITVDAGRSNTVSLPVSGLESAAENDNSLAARRGAPVPGGPCFRGGAGRAQRHHRCGAGGH